MPRLALAMLGLVALSSLFAAPAKSDICNGGGPFLGVVTLGVGTVEITDGVAAHTYYVDDRPALDDQLSFYRQDIYAENNQDWSHPSAGVYTGVAPRDLQRGGTSNLLPGDSDPCMDNDYSGLGPDQLIF